MKIDGKIASLKQIIDSSENIVLFTGAGMSVPSGIPDFRSADGLYATEDGNFSAEHILAEKFFKYRTGEFFKFYKTKMLYPDARPNPAHIFFAELERKGKLKAVVTQNIDGLHSAAGCRQVLELHGSVQRNYCLACGKSGFGVDYILSSSGVPRCDVCGGTVRPDVVLYGERLDDATVSSAIDAFEAADALIIVGTSLVVYPSAGLVDYFRGRSMVIVNKTPTPRDRIAQLCIHDDIVAVIEKLKALE